MVLASSLLLLVGTASAHGTASPAAGEEPPSGQCTVKSLPSFVAQGEFATTATVADVIEVGCDPAEYGTGSEVSVIASQLYSRCQGLISWYIPNPYKVSAGRSVTLTLDADGNATVALIAGPKCQAGESLITVHEIDEPFESFTTPYTVLPPNDTEKGVFALPASQIEDSESSGVGTIIEAEFPGASEDKIRFGSEELLARCRRAPHLHWITEARGEVTGVSEVNGLELDDNGNIFVVAIGDSSCYPGASLVEADLESKPFTTETTDFTIESPKPRD
jgi:hypothetical protein